MPYFTFLKHRLFYREQGSGPMLLVLPGNTASSACHQAELDTFSDRYHVVSLDFLGTGQSDHLTQWPADWWMQGAAQAAALVEHLGYANCVTMGTSGGAVVALLMAIHFPQTVRAVVADSTVEQFSAEMLRRNVIEDRARRTPEQAQFWQFAHGPDWETVIKADTQMIANFVAQTGGNWFGGQLSKVQCPTLLTASKQDSMFGDVIRQNCKMAEQIPDCRLFINNTGDHPLIWSQPDAFRGVCDQFLQSIEQ